MSLAIFKFLNLGPKVLNFSQPNVPLIAIPVSDLDRVYSLVDYQVLEGNNAYRYQMTGVGMR